MLSSDDNSAIHYDDNSTVNMLSAFPHGSDHVLYNNNFKKNYKIMDVHGQMGPLPFLHKLFDKKSDIK